MKNKEKNLENKENEKEAGELTGVRPHCDMKVYEDPHTGELVITYSKDCSKEYVERIAGRIATKGVRFSEEKDESK
jgi:hypothetical protein